MYRNSFQTTLYLPNEMGIILPLSCFRHFFDAARNGLLHIGHAFSLTRLGASRNYIVVYSCYYSRNWKARAKVFGSMVKVIDIFQWQMFKEFLIFNGSVWTRSGMPLEMRKAIFAAHFNRLLGKKVGVAEG